MTWNYDSVNEVFTGDMTQNNVQLEEYKFDLEGYTYYSNLQ